VSPDPAPEEVVFIRSDQYSFVRKGVPSVALAAGYQAVDPSLNGKKISDAWESTRYHQPSDDMGQPLDFKAGAKYARLVLAVGYAIAQDGERPRWNPGDFFLRFNKEAAKDAE
jgi:Zn-dependent M28 family amino/carboxypeptidase